MLPFDDPKWEQLEGGYRVPYDARPALLKLERDDDAWDDIWQDLHHQGDVGEASYAAVPHLVRIFRASRQRDWNLYAFVATVEIERHCKKNPPLPQWLEDGYRTAWITLCELALNDLRSANEHLLIQPALAVIALAKGQLKLGVILAHTDESEIDTWLEELHAWSDLYVSDR